MADEVFINLISPEGEAYNGPPEFARWALNNGYRVASDEEVLKFKAQQEAEQRREIIRQTVRESPVGAIAASAGSAADALTLGGFSEALEAISPEKAEILNAAQGENKTASNVGAIAGLGASLGTGKPVFDAITRTGKVAGAAVEGAAARAIGNVANDAVAGAAGKAIGTTARYATEGMVAAIPQAAPDAFLGDPEDAAESLLLGGVIGGGIGTAVHAGGSLTAMALKRTREGAVKVAEGISSKANALADKVSDTFGVARTAGETVASKASGAVRTAREGVAGALNTAADAVEGAAPTLAGMADDATPGVEKVLTEVEYNQIEKMLGIGKAMRKRLNRDDPNFTKKLIDFVKEKKLVKLDFDAQTELVDAQKFGDEAGKEIRSILQGVDATKKRFVDTTALLGRLNEIGEQIPKSALFDTERRTFEKAMGSIIPRLEKPNGLSKMPKLTTLQDMKNELRKYGFNDRFDQKPGKEIVGQMWRAIDDEIGNSLEWAGQQFPEQAELWRKAKRDFFFYNRLSETLEEAAAQRGNQMVSLSDMLWSIGGAGIGGVGGGVTGFVANSLRQRYGASAAAIMARGLNDAIKRRDFVIGTSVEKFLSTVGTGFREAAEAVKPGAASPRAPVATMPRERGTLVDFGRYLTGRERDTSREAARDISDVLATFGSNVYRTADRLQGIAGDVNALEPKVGAVLTERLGRAATYLNQHSPKPDRPGTPFQSEVFEPSEQQLFSFENRFRAAVDPYSLLEDLRNGILTPEGVETVRELYPRFYEKVMGTLVEKAAEKPRNFGFQQRQQLSLILGDAVDDLLAPKTVRQFQSFYARADSHEKPGQGPKLKLPGAEPTQLDRVLAR